MEQITLRIPEDTLESLDDEAGEHGISRSEHIRDILETRNEHTEKADELRAEHAEEVDELRDEIDDLEGELERVREEKRLILQEREEKAELARYAEDKRTRAQRKDDAPIWTVAKWKVFGMPSDDDADT